MWFHFSVGTSKLNREHEVREVVGMLEKERRQRAHVGSRLAEHVGQIGHEHVLIRGCHARHCLFVGRFTLKHFFPEHEFDVGGKAPDIGAQNMRLS